MTDVDKLLHLGNYGTVQNSICVNTETVNNIDNNNKQRIRGCSSFVTNSRFVLMDLNDGGQQ